MGDWFTAEWGDPGSGDRGQTGLLKRISGKKRRKFMAVLSVPGGSGAGGQVDGFGEAAALLQAFLIEFPAQCGSGRAVMHVEVFQAFADQVGAGIGDGPFGDEAAAERDVAH